MGASLVWVLIHEFPNVYIFIWFITFVYNVINRSPEVEKQQLFGNYTGPRNFIICLLLRCSLGIQIVRYYEKVSNAVVFTHGVLIISAIIILSNGRV